MSTVSKEKRKYTNLRILLIKENINMFNCMLNEVSYPDKPMKIV